MNPHEILNTTKHEISKKKIALDGRFSLIVLKSDGLYRFQRSTPLGGDLHPLEHEISQQAVG